MPLEGAFVKRGGALWPTDPEARALLRSIGQGKMAMISIRVPRSIKQNRFVHGLLHEIVKHTDRYFDVDDLKRFLKIRTRMYHLRTMPDGSVVLELQHTDFGAMDHVQFQRVWERWRYIIRTEIFPDIDEELLRTTILAEIA
jgi:hypothetical protein